LFSSTEHPTPTSRRLGKFSSFGGGFYYEADSQVFISSGYFLFLFLFLFLFRRPCQHLTAFCTTKTRLFSPE
jgi:hypothetical protein